MKPITPSLPFLEFPTDEVLRTFRPVRALLVETPPPADAQKPHLFATPEDIVKLELHDPRPLLEAIAIEMGYDPDKIASGQGETGVSGHTWVTYCSEQWLPMLVRWQAGEAELLVTMVESFERGAGPSDLRMTILGDAAAKPILRRLAVALARFGVTRRDGCRGTTTVDGEVRPLGLPEIALARLDSTLVVSADAQGRLDETRAGELPDLLHSCDASGLPGATQMPVGTAELWLQHRYPQKMTFAPGRAIPPELVELIQQQSVQKARDLTTRELRRFFASKESRSKSSWLGQARTESAEAQQQRAYLAGTLLEIERASPTETSLLSRPGLPFDTYALRTGVTSVGDDLRWPAAEVFAGAGPQSTPKGMSRGLIELALGAVEQGVMMMWRMKEKEWSKPPRAGWVSRDMKEALLKGPGSPRAKIFRAEKPSFGIHQGLPIAVNYSAVVWRKQDAQALAIDFAYHRPSDGVHLARVRRCAAPGRE